MRHPLERVLSAYRSEYEGKREELSWPQFVDKLISNGLGPEPGARDTRYCTVLYCTVLCTV